MLMSLLSHLLCAWFAFLLPSYATFKALAHRPLSEQELQRWAMYWSVVGAFVAFEYCAEWLVSWLPFYWEVKTLFLLYLALPQTQGSTYIYATYLQPFFTRHEVELDEGIVQVQKNVLVFIQSRLTTLWDYILSAANKRQASSSTSSATSPTSTANGTTPAGFSFQGVYSLWQTYGTSIINTLGSKGVTGVSSTSVQTASTTATQRRAQDDNGSNPSPAGTPSTPNPPFPEAQHF